MVIYQMGCLQLHLCRLPYSKWEAPGSVLAAS